MSGAFSCSQAGLVNNLNDGLAWGLFPIYFAAAGVSIARIGVLAAIYPAVWGLGQLVTGGLSDRVGRKWLIAGGMLTQAGAIGWIAATSGFVPWAIGGVALGRVRRWFIPRCSPPLATSRIHAGAPRGRRVPTLARRGFAVGALLAGIIADAFGIATAIWTVAVLTALSGPSSPSYVRDPPVGPSGHRTRSARRCDRCSGDGADGRDCDRNQRVKRVVRVDRPVPCVERSCLEEDASAVEPRYQSRLRDPCPAQARDARHESDTPDANRSNE